MDIREHMASITTKCRGIETEAYSGYPPESIAYALAGLSPLQSDLMRVKYALELERMPDLGRKWLIHIVDTLSNLQYKRGSEAGRRLANMGVAHVLRNNRALIEYIARSAVDDSVNHWACPVCHGRASVVVDANTLHLLPAGTKVSPGGVVICTNCAGLGRKPQTARARAQIAGIPERTWFRHWEPVFRELRDELGFLEDSAANIMRNRLS